MMVVRAAILVLATLASSCAANKDSAGDPAAPATIVGRERAAPIATLRDAIRQQARRLYGDECGAVYLPDRAFIPIEITGGGLSEYAVLFGRAYCARDGNSGRWKGTGGTKVQFWLASGGPPRMLLEHQMHGFTTVPTGVLSLQHGAYCPGGAGAGVCLVEYRWNGKDRTLEVASRTLYDENHRGEPPAMEWSHEAISR